MKIKVVGLTAEFELGPEHRDQVFKEELKTRAGDKILEVIKPFAARISDMGSFGNFRTVVVKLDRRVDEIVVSVSEDDYPDEDTKEKYEPGFFVTTHLNYREVNKIRKYLDILKEFDAKTTIFYTVIPPNFRD